MSISALIVDSDRLFVDSLVEHLEGKGIRARGVTSGKVAERHVFVLRPDSVIVDAHMPDAPALAGRLQRDLPETTLVLLCRQPHRCGSGNFVVLDRSHGLQYLITTLDALLGPAVAPAGAVVVANPRERARASLQQLIERQGYAVYAVANGRDALGFLAKAPETLIAILDVEMPDRGGLDCLKGVLSTTPHHEVIITGEHPDSRIRGEAAKLGAFDYIYEPFEPAILGGSLAAALLHREYRRSRSLWGRTLPRFSERARIPVKYSAI